MPDNKVKQYWDIYVVFLLIYTALVVPYTVCFNVNRDGPFEKTWDLFIDASFFVDIILTFFTALSLDQKLVIVDRGIIAKTYIKGWFFIDIFTTVPFNLFMGGSQSVESLEGGANNKALRLARLPRLYRLLRVLRLLRILKILKMSEQMNRGSTAKFTKKLKLYKNIKYMVQISFTVLYVTNLVACLWFFIPSMNEFEGKSWVWSKDMIDADAFSQFLMSFYWAYQTVLTIGYGDITPQGFQEQILCMLWMIIGVGMYSYLIGNIISMINEYDHENEELQNQIDVVKQYQSENGLSQKIANRIMRHIRNNIINKKFEESEKLLNYIPTELRFSVVQKTHQSVFENVKFFENRSSEFTSRVVYELKPLNLGLGDLTFSQGDAPNDIFFIWQGKIKLISDLNDLIVNDELDGCIKEYTQIVQNINKLQQNDEVKDQTLHHIDITRVGMVSITQYKEGSVYGDSDIFAQEAGMANKDSGRDVFAITMSNQAGVYVLNIKAIMMIKEDFPDIFNELSTKGCSRFMYQEIQIAHALRKYLAIAVDGKNDEFCVEHDVEISDMEEYEEILLEADTEKLRDMLLKNLSKLPDGVKLPSQRMMIDDMVNKRKKLGKSIQDDQIELIKRLFFEQPLSAKNLSKMIDNDILSKHLVHTVPQRVMNHFSGKKDFLNRKKDWDLRFQLNFLDLQTNVDFMTGQVNQISIRAQGQKTDTKELTK